MIAIKDMEMPKSCGECNCSETGVCKKWVYLKGYDLGKKRADDCPLVEIGTCKDCRYREGIDLDACFCAKHGNSARDDFYCKDFEMRGNKNGTENILSMR